MNIHSYFDWAATAPADEEILRRCLNTSLEYTGNPSSVHKAGIEAKNLICDARTRCGTILGVSPDTLYFTSGGTEGDYLPILSLLQRPSPGSIVISAIEHPAIREQAEMMKNCGWKVYGVQPNQEGIITPEAVIEKLDEDTALVCVMAVNNETGAIQPIYEIADALIQYAGNKRKPKFHVDAVQALGKIPLQLSHKGIDSASFSGHKIRGPRGIGLLYMAQRQEPFLRGGGQESGIRSGTENLFGILAFTECLERYGKETIVATENTKQNKQTQRFIKNIESLQSKGKPLASIIPLSRKEKPEQYSPWVLQVSFKNIPGEVLVRALSDKGFYISTGSACSSRKMSRPVLEAMKVSKEDATNAVRFSFGPTTTEEDIDSLFETLKSIVLLFN
jgi:cysteine desulfurase